MEDFTANLLQNNRIIKNSIGWGRSGGAIEAKKLLRYFHNFPFSPYFPPKRGRAPTKFGKSHNWGYGVLGGICSHRGRRPATSGENWLKENIWIVHKNSRNRDRIKYSSIIHFWGHYSLFNSVLVHNFPKSL